MDLQIIWFCVIGFLFTGYLVLEGFDFGVGMLLPVLGRHSERRRKTVIETIGPVWDGNEVWLIAGGGALFAAFPDWYATMFSGFYFLMLAILVGLIIRVVSIEWRGKVETESARRLCDYGIIVGSWLPPFMWGIVFANLLRGVPIDAQKQMVGSFGDLLNPFALLGGLTLLAVFFLHGAYFVALKTRGTLSKDARVAAMFGAAPAVVFGGSFLLLAQIQYGKTWTWLLVALAVAALVASIVANVERRDGWAFVGTTVTVLATVVLIFASLFPNVMPSTLDTANSLTIRNASSSAYTLTVMSWAALFLTPLILAYQAWTYWVFRKRLSADVDDEEMVSLY